MNILMFKRALLAVSTLLLLPAFALAQDGTQGRMGEFGLRFMPTFSALTVANSTGGTFKGEVTLGYGVGGLLAFNFAKHVGVQAEVIYNSYSQKFTDLNVEHNIKLKYVNIPLLLSLNTGKDEIFNFNVVAGPQLGISVGTTLENSTSNNNVDLPVAVLSVKKGDLGFAYGAGIDFGINPSRSIRVGLGYRGVYGLFDISDHSRSVTNTSYYILDRTHIKTNSVYLGLSIRF
jgi:opacity protein-like surface antigen